MSEEKKIEGLNNSVKSVNKKRRAFTKAGMATPIIMTLASRPVFGAQCLSDMLSTTMSGAPGNTCFGGQSPGFWKALTGRTDNGVVAESAWSMTGLEYGTLQTSCTSSNGNPKPCKPNKWESYIGGTAYDSLFTDSSIKKSLREVLNTMNGDDEFHLTAGILNAMFYEAHATDFYMISVADFWDMYFGRAPIPAPYTSLRDLIESNYHNNPR